jgi:hypothetical protein
VKRLDWIHTVKWIIVTLLAMRLLQLLVLWLRSVLT